MKKAIKAVCFFMLLTMLIVMPASAATRYVCAVGCDYTDIQTAIDASSDEDTVFVYNGTYSGGAVYIDKNLTLKGEGADVVTLTGMIGILIGSSNAVHGCVVEGFKILNTNTGVIIFPMASNCTIRSNIIDGMSGLWGYPYGSIIYSSHNNFINNVIINATTAHGTLYLWAGADFNTIANNTIINNQLTDSDWAGAIVLEEADHSLIIDNTIINNAGSGILLYASENNTITRNNISSNERGLWWQQWDLSEASEGNRIYFNNFNNIVDVALYEGCIPISNNTWNSTTADLYYYNGETYTNHLGNYWSNYPGGDSDGDGIGDDPYSVPNSSDTDFRPLMTGFENYQETYVPPLASSAVTLGATILPAISIEVTPATLDFGILAPGQSSDERNLSINNTGGSNVTLTADVTDTANNLFISGLLLDSGIWSAYSSEVLKSTVVNTAVVLDAPGDYAGVGTQEGTLIIWAEAA